MRERRDPRGCPHLPGAGQRQLGASIERRVLMHDKTTTNPADESGFHTRVAHRVSACEDYVVATVGCSSKEKAETEVIVDG